MLFQSSLQQGLSPERAKDITKLIKENKGWLLREVMDKRLKRELEEAIIRMEMDPNLRIYLSRFDKPKPKEPLSLESKRKFQFEEE